MVPVHHFRDGIDLAMRLEFKLEGLGVSSSYDRCTERSLFCRYVFSCLYELAVFDNQANAK